VTVVLWFWVWSGGRALNVVVEVNRVPVIQIFGVAASIKAAD
jgi:hypothetical protein